MKKGGLGIFAQAEMMFEGTKEIPARQELTCSALSSFSMFFHLLTPQASQTSAFPSRVGKGLWERKEIGLG